MSVTMWQEWKPLFLCTAGQNVNCCRIFKKYQMATHQGVKQSYDKFTTSIMKTQIFFKNWRNKMGYIHSIKTLLAIKKNGTIIHASAWIDFGDIIQSEGSNLHEMSNSQIYKNERQNSSYLRVREQYRRENNCQEILFSF